MRFAAPPPSLTAKVGELNWIACDWFTVTLKLHVETLPEESVAVTATGVVPTLNNEPDTGLVTTTTPLQLSVAVGLKVTIA